MPPVELIDLRDEFQKGNKSILSDELQAAITATLAKSKQVMLLVNRRGAATFVVCRDCGQVETCPKCEIPLTYHPSEGQILKCHHCDHRKAVPAICPACGSAAIKYFGLGTQRAELEVKKLFPKARVVRMDHDTTLKRGSHEEIYHDFKTEKFDILIGTQMIAKGWDLPNVELVGVIAADTSLNLPDFRSAERTFSLLTQVAGRVGRGYHPGKVIIQTYNPDSYAVLAASKHSYQSFYEKEIVSRQKYHYPPFGTLIKLTFSDPVLDKCHRESSRLHLLLQENLPREINIIGPSPAFIEKLAGKYRFQMILKIPDSLPSPETQILTVIKQHLRPGWQVDVDPESLL